MSTYCTPMFASHLRPVSRKSRKAISKTATRLFCKAGLLISCKGILFKITATFRASRRLRFEGTKRIMSSEIRPKSFGTLEKRDPDPSTILTTEAGLLQYRSKFSQHCRTPRESLHALRESRSARPRKTFTGFRLSCNLKWSFNSLKRNNFHYLQ